jgi:sec-independent protein translocase protein TatB
MNLGFTEMAFLFVLALLIFGPRKLPEIGRQIGRGLSEFKRASNEFKAQIETEVRDLELNADLEARTIAPPATPAGTVAVKRGGFVEEAAPAPAVAPPSDPDTGSTHA